MDDRLALLQAIRCSPTDNTPRLVYADWLDDHGDPVRANFIRRSCKLHEMAEGDPERREAREEIDALWTLNRKAWLAPAVRQLGADVRQTQHHKGFPVVALSADTLARVNLDTLAEACSDAVGLRVLPNSNYTHSDISMFAASPYLGLFNVLYVLLDAIDLSAIRAIAENPAASRLIQVHLDKYNSIVNLNENDCVALAESTHLANLRHLTVTHPFLSTNSAVALTNGVYRETLEFLSLAYCKIDNQAARAIAGERAALPNLELLDLTHNTFGQEGIAELACSERFPATAVLQAGDRQPTVRKHNCSASFEHSIGQLRTMLDRSVRGGLGFSEFIRATSSAACRGR